jgi:hypothetical protein
MVRRPTARFQDATARVEFLRCGSGLGISDAQHSHPEISPYVSEGSMNSAHDTNFSKRLETAAAAKKLLLDKLRPKAAATDPLFAEREAMKAAELAQVRADRSQARADAKQAIADSEEAKLAAQAALDLDALTAKRGERKERKALSAAEAKAKRDAKYAARKSRN